MKKRSYTALLSVMLSAAMMFCNVPLPFSPAVTAAAEELSSYSTVFPIQDGLMLPEMTELTEEEHEQLLASQLSFSEFSEDPDNDPAEESIFDKYDFSTDYYYDQLSDDEKRLWNDLKALGDKVFRCDTDFEDVILPEGVEVGDVDVEFSGDIYYLFVNSNPKYYFFSTSLSYDPDDNKIYPNLDPCFLKAEERKKCTDAIAELTENWMSEIEKLCSDTEKEKYIIEKIVDHAEYGDPLSEEPIDFDPSGDYTDKLSPITQTIASSLYKRITVCAGFSKTMVYFCNAAGIECIVVPSFSSRHSWNRVKLDGIWYETDITMYNAGHIVCLNKSHETMTEYSKTISPETQIYDYTVPDGIVLPDCPADLEKTARSISFGELSDKPTFVLTGSTIRPEFTIEPSDASIGSVYFYTLDPEIAKVSPDGTVTGISSGSTAVCASCPLTQEWDYYWIYVIDNIDPSKPNETISACAGEVMLLHPDLEDYGNMTGIAIESLDPEICEVLIDMIIPKKSGTAYFIVYFYTDEDETTIPYIVDLTVTDGIPPYDYDNSGSITEGDLKELAQQIMGGNYSDLDYDFNKDGRVNGIDLIYFRIYLSMIADTEE